MAFGWWREALLSRPRAAYSWVLRRPRARRPAMAKRTVGDWEGEGKREAGATGLDEALSALSKSMAAQAKELAARLMESGSSAPRVDGLVREAVLEAGRMDDVLAALRKPGAGAEERAKAIRYLSERRGQMRYDEYRSLGLPIGSGRVEAACKTVVGRRMKCTGMRWTVAGANPVLWVRCARLSGWFDDYWEHRLRKAA